MIAASDANRHHGRSGDVLKISRGAASPASRSRAFSATRNSGACRLQLSPATLVPRPDTETVVELALEMLRADRAPQPAAAHRRHRHRLGRDSAGAVVRAAGGERRRHRHQPGGACRPHAAMPRAWASPPRATFVACDYAAALSGPFDLIVSNPPYIRSADIAGLDRRGARSRSARARWTAAPTGSMPIAR